MPLLGDRNYAGAHLVSAIGVSGAHLLIPTKANRKPPMTCRLPDGPGCRAAVP
jgi:hypothetical protein